ncbi:MAG TPA: DMT family transporter [Candidatus Binatia bacterium]|nr:DMT family transporter [Candidatus Binatia bacterium]
MTPQQERIGLLSAAVCALNGAFVPAVAKLTTSRGEPLFVAAATSVFAGMCAAAVLSVRGELRVLARPTVGPRLVAVAALGTAAAFFLFFLGASRASAIDAVLCLQIEPAYALLLAWLVLGHRPTLRRIGAIATLLVGIALAMGAHGVSGSPGMWILLVTPLCWQASHLIVLRGLVGITPSILTGARYIHGGLLLALGWLISGGVTRLPATDVVLGQLPWLAVQGVVLSYAGTLLWYGAITRLDLARTTAIVVPSVPLLSLGASFLILGEVPSGLQWVGLALTAGGVLAFITAPHAASA